MPCASRHEKNASRASQQMARALRLGASKAPSEEGLGALGGVEVGAVEKRPIVGFGGGGGARRGGSKGEGEVGRGAGWLVWERDGDVGWKWDRFKVVGRWCGLNEMLWLLKLGCRSKFGSRNG